MPGNHPILASERHDVGNRTQRREREHFGQQVTQRRADPCRPADFLGYRPGQLEGHAGTTQVRIRVGVIQQGMDYRIRVGKRLAKVW